MRSQFLKTPQLNFSLTYVSLIEFHMETSIILRWGFRSQTTQIFLISRCRFSEDGWEMYKVLKYTFWAVILPIMILQMAGCVHSFWRRHN